ncbi:hypothetical protein [Mameliella alba]|uniref:hypothetical protein n=1 Tax=Mameliella alba TaxID=561184 RepID=UPI000B52D519|nr:hypothetical protein [Mameliella alba]OWV40388.1 hypothetical protein CDZ95_21410 [Mameliella alba]
MEEELLALLSGAVAWRVSWGSLGEDDGLPRAAIYRQGGERDHTMRGPAGMTSRVQIDCYGETFAEAIGASRALRQVLEGYRGGVILGAFLKSVRDDLPEDVGPLRRVSMIFSVVHRD